jgi:para-nitrobenzyl esterase
MKAGWVGALALLMAGAGIAMAQAPAAQVKVAQGALQGVRDNGANSYRNLPFAAPPLGALRFAPPAAPVAWTGVRDASKFGPSCMQEHVRANGPFSDEYFAAPPFSEDCLTLNVWTTGGSGKAVLLYIPGGASVQGGGNLAVYNGANLARADVVAVTMNYRLGAAGFLTYPGLPTDAHGSGNYALHDIIAALRWIQANITAFGGDPAKVTIMGQSAGAGAILAILNWPEARGLLRGAIINSGVRDGSMGSAMPAAAALEAGQAWAKSRRATDVASLRALPAQALVPRNGDPRMLPGTIPQAGVTVPSAVDVPILTGWNSGEGAGSGPQPNLTLANYPQRLSALVASAPGALATAYPAGQDAVAALRKAGHDATMMGGASWVKARLAATHSPVYYFDFEHVMPGYAAADWGSHHSSELPYIFGTLDVLAGRPLTPADRQVSQIMQSYFVNFIKTGNPNGAGPEGARLAAWRPFDPAANDVMALGLKSGMRPLANSERLTAWRAVYK